MHYASRIGSIILRQFIPTVLLSNQITISSVKVQQFIRHFIHVVLLSNYNYNKFTQNTIVVF